MNFWRKYYYIEQGKRSLSLWKNIIDIVLLLIYVGISFYNAIYNIHIMQNTNSNVKDLERTVTLVVMLNFIILAKNQIKILCKIERYRNKEMLRKEREGKVVSEICILAWKEKVHIIYYGYLAIAVLLITIYFTGNQILYPIGLVAVFVIIITFILELIDSAEDIFGLVPIIYFGERG